jgi:hypothetical protein
MTACDTVARSQAYLSCSSLIPHRFFCGLFSGDGRTIGAVESSNLTGHILPSGRLKHGLGHK